MSDCRCDSSRTTDIMQLEKEQMVVQYLEARTPQKEDKIMKNICRWVGMIFTINFSNVCS